MRLLKTLLLIGGVLLLVVLVYRVGTEPIVETLERLTWWQFILICLPYAAIMAVDTLGWRFAFARDRASFRRLYGARVVGEALNIVTAVGSVGGEAAKAWLVRKDVTYEESVPSVVIAKTTITIAQALFLIIGIVLAWAALDVGSDILRGMVWLLVVEVAAVGGFFGAQLAGLVARGGRMLKAFGVIDDVGSAQKLDAALRTYYRREWRRFALSVMFPLAGWLLGALEALIMLWALGIDMSVVTATTIEALGSGVRFATFLVPASLGAFEGANAAAFGALGFGASAGLAFSFVRRARQAVWVVMGIVLLLPTVMRRRRAARSSRGPAADSERRPGRSGA
jgi:glycosyltransferase 2 family protein